jgi:hypothetical protein
MKIRSTSGRFRARALATQIFQLKKKSIRKSGQAYQF